MIFLIPVPGGATIRVEVDTEQASALFDAMSERMKDMRPVYRKIANRMRKSFAENFRAGGRPNRWTPLSPNTVASKEQNPTVVYNNPLKRRRVRRLEQLNDAGIPQRSPANMLIVRGDLRDSAATKNKDHIERVNKRGLEIGSKHWLSEIHQFGTKPYTIMPKRFSSLRFITASGVSFARKVNHPGIPARPFILAQDDDIVFAKEEAAAHVVGD